MVDKTNVMAQLVDKQFPELNANYQRPKKHVEKKWCHVQQKELYDAISNIITDNQEKYVKVKKIKQSMADEIMDPKKQNGDQKEKQIKLAVYRHLVKKLQDLWNSYKNY